MLEQANTIKSILIKDITEEGKLALLDSLYKMSQNNLQSIGKDYLKKRFDTYQIITFLTEAKSNQVIAFSFSKFYLLSYFKTPIFHFGLTVIDKRYRGKKISILISKSVYKLLLEKKIINKLIVWLFGLCFIAKSSSPVPFLKIKKSTFSLHWPRVKNERELSYLSRTRLSQYFSRFLSQLTGENITNDYILKDTNGRSVFLIHQENYNFTLAKDQTIVRFFKNHIIPNHSLLSIAWVHPIALYFQKSYKSVESTGRKD